MAEVRRQLLSDRFIAPRTNSKQGLNSLSITKTKIDVQQTDSTDYTRLIRTANRSYKTSIFEKHHSSQKSLLTFQNSSFEFLQTLKNIKPLKKKTLLLQPEQIIDAPNIVDNFYFNILDWSFGEIVGVGLGKQAFLRTGDEKVIELVRRTKTTVTSLKFHSGGRLLALGDESGRIQIIDVQKNINARLIKSHQSRIGCIQYLDEHCLLSGSKDGNIARHDLRLSHSIVGSFKQHRGEICGISAKNKLVASGSNENSVLIWDLTTLKTIQSNKHHLGAVKAIGWCPWRTNVLATGGGSRDRKLILWNFLSNEVEQTVQVGSQVTSLSWRPMQKEILTTHSGKSKGYGLIWSQKEKQFVCKLQGGIGRMLGGVINPINENDICTINANQMMSFWRIEDEQNSKTFKRCQSDQNLFFSLTE